MPKTLKDYYKFPDPEPRPVFPPESSNGLVVMVLFSCFIIIGLALWKIVDLIKYYAN